MKTAFGLINLSTIPSEQIMELCLTAVLDRPEWGCFEEEHDNPLFSEQSSLTRNYKTLNTHAVRAKLTMLARIADVTGHHLPIRGVLCLICQRSAWPPRGLKIVSSVREVRQMRLQGPEPLIRRRYTVLYSERTLPPTIVARGRFSGFWRCCISATRPQTISTN